MHAERELDLPILSDCVSVCVSVCLSVCPMPVLCLNEWASSQNGELTYYTYLFLYPGIAAPQPRNTRS